MPLIRSCAVTPHCAETFPTLQSIPSAPMQPRAIGGRDDDTSKVLALLIDLFAGITLGLDTTTTTTGGVGYTSVISSPNVARRRIIRIHLVSAVPVGPTLCIGHTMPRFRSFGLHISSADSLVDATETPTAPNLDVTTLSLVAIQQIGIYQKGQHAHTHTHTGVRDATAASSRVLACTVSTRSARERKYRHTIPTAFRSSAACRSSTGRRCSAFKPSTGMPVPPPSRCVCNTSVPTGPATASSIERAPWARRSPRGSVPFSCIRTATGQQTTGSRTARRHLFQHRKMANPNQCFKNPQAQEVKFLPPAHAANDGQSGQSNTADKHGELAPQRPATTVDR